MWLETGLGDFLGIRLQVIDAANAVEDFKAQPGIVAQKAADGDDVGGIDNDKGVDGVELLRLNAVAELLFEDGDDVGSGHGNSEMAQRLLIAVAYCAPEIGCDP